MRPKGRWLLAAFLAAALLPASAGMAANAKKSAPDNPAPPQKPKLSLQASPLHGFLPLTITLYGRLEGVDKSDSRFCHAGVEWTGTTGAGQVMRSTEDTRCLHAPTDTVIEHAYQKTFVVDTEGIYRYQLTLHLNNGEKIRSNSVDVHVISNN